MGLVDDLGAGPVAIDTAIFIYFIEEHVRYHRLVEPVFEHIDRGRLPAVTSTITLLETLVVPYRARNQRLAKHYEAILCSSRGLRMVDIDLPVLRAAGLLRATLGCRTPDALQLASALSAGCSSLLTNDHRFRGPSDIKIVQLDDYLPTTADL